jgi:oxalate decarboxylase/phosphoglucose isomerase-like protein (cupin superfamily)
VENVGDETVTCLEVLQAPRYTDMSVGQWLGLTPPQIVSDTLHLPQSLIDRLPKVKRWVVPGNANYSTTNFTDVSMMEKREPRGWTRNAKLRG